MSDRAKILPEQGRMTRLGEIRVVEFIRDALCAGKRAVLVTGRGPSPARAPDSALTGFGAQTLRIGPPLPEPFELQHRIGAAVGIAGAREMAPLAFAARLLFAAPGPSLILAIDDAHLLSYRTLAYLTEITELLAPDAPILQIVLAAHPVFLDTLARPEFEGFRTRLCRPAFEILQPALDAQSVETVPGLAANRAASASEREKSGPSRKPISHARKRSGTSPLAAQAAAGLTVLGCLAAVGYVALPEGLIRQVKSTLTSPATPAKSGARLAPKQAHGVADPLIDALADAVANGPADLVAVLIERIANLEASASPEGLRLVAAMPDRFAARAIAAAAAGRVDEARRLEQFLLLTYPAHVRPDLLMASNPKSPPSRPTVAPDERGARAPADPTPAASSGVTQPPAQSAAAEPAAAATPTKPVEPSGPTGLNSFVAGSEGPATPAPANAPRQGARDVAPPTIVARAAPMEPQGPPPPPVEQSGSAAHDNLPTAPPASAAWATPTPERPPALLTGLPTLAPVRVVLNVAQDDILRAGRAEDIRQALVSAGLEVARFVPVDPHGPGHGSGPSIGYYFQSDRKAAAGVSRALEPLLGVVHPVALRMHGTVPEPGTIEIAVP